MAKQEKDRLSTVITKDDTRMLKGAAILLMLIHHVFGSQVLFAGGGKEILYLIPLDNMGYHGVLEMLSNFGSICVILYFFLSGFGLYRSYEQSGNCRTMARLKGFYISYWKVLLPFVAIGTLFFSHQDTSFAAPGMGTDTFYAFSHFDLTYLIKSMSGLAMIYNLSWWFILPYLFCLITFPLWARIVDRLPAVGACGVVMLLIILQRLPWPDANTTLWTNVLMRNGGDARFLMFYLGAALAKDRTLDNLQNQWASLTPMPVLADLVGLLFIVVLMTTNFTDMPMVWVTLFTIMAGDLFRRVAPLGRFMSLMGKHSTNIWLFHTFLFFYFGKVSKLVYMPKYAALILPWFTLMCLAVSICLNAFWKLAGRGTSALLAAAHRGRAGENK